jgi:hypothetical protein
VNKFLSKDEFINLTKNGQLLTIWNVHFHIKKRI